MAILKDTLDLEERGYESSLHHSSSGSSINSGPKPPPGVSHSEKPRIADIPDERITVVPSRGFPSLQPYFDRVVPPHRRYFGHSRKYCLWVSLGLMSALFVFILGLAVAVTRGKPVEHTTSIEAGVHYDGDITYYDPALGACGRMATNADAVVAVGISHWDQHSRGSNPNNNGVCNRQILITNVNGRPVNKYVTVTDRCVGCKPGDLDVSRSVYSSVADLSLGRTTVGWQWA